MVEIISKQGGGLLIRIDVKQLLARINNISNFPDIK